MSGIQPMPRIGQLPAAAAIHDGRVEVVLDGANPADVATGSGSSRHLVICNGTTWEAVGLQKEYILPPDEGLWQVAAGTPTHQASTTGLHYWEFTDTGTTDRITANLPLPLGWQGLTLDKITIQWATDGTSTTALTYRLTIYEFLAGTADITAAGTSVYDTGNTTVTPSGTANQLTETVLSASGSFNASADHFRVLFHRRSQDDSNTDGLRVVGWKILVS